MLCGTLRSRLVFLSLLCGILENSIIWTLSTNKRRIILHLGCAREKAANPSPQAYLLQTSKKKGCLTLKGTLPEPSEGLSEAIWLNKLTVTPYTVSRVSRRGVPICACFFLPHDGLQCWCGYQPIIFVPFEQEFDTDIPRTGAPGAV